MTESFVVDAASSEGLAGHIRAEPVPGFIESSFNPVVYRLLCDLLAPQPEANSDVGVVLASLFGDSETSDIASQKLARGQRRNPLLFYQSVPSAILGYASAQFGIRGPMVTVSGCGDLLPSALSVAGSLCRSSAVSTIIVLVISSKSTARVDLLRQNLGQCLPARPSPACGFAIRLRRRVGTDGAVDRGWLLHRERSGAIRVENAEQPGHVYSLPDVDDACVAPELRATMALCRLIGHQAGDK